MKFEYGINPLQTKVFLDDADRKLLRMAIRLDAALDAISYRDLRDKAAKPEDAERYASYIKKYDDIAYDDIAYDEDAVSEEIDKQVAMYEEELKSGHCGDCICFACSCMKCWAEGLLGIDTLKGLGQHEAHNIDQCFIDTTKEPWSYVERTVDEVVALLSIPTSPIKNEHWKNSSQEDWDKHLPRWESERKRALEWYKNYIKEHGFE